MGNGDIWDDKCTHFNTLDACEEFFKDENGVVETTPNSISMYISAMRNTIELVNKDSKNYYNDCADALEKLADVLQNNVAIHEKFPAFFEQIEKKILKLLAISKPDTCNKPRSIQQKPNLRNEITESFQDFMRKALLQERQVSFEMANGTTKTVYIPNASILLLDNPHHSLVEKIKDADKLNETLKDLVTRNAATIPPRPTLADFKKILEDQKASEFEQYALPIETMNNFTRKTRGSIPGVQDSDSDEEAARDSLYDALYYALNNFAEDIKGSSASIFDVKNIDGAEETIKKITAFTGVSIDKKQLLDKWNQLSSKEAKQDFETAFNRELNSILDGGGLLESGFVLNQYISTAQATADTSATQIDNPQIVSSAHGNTENASHNTPTITESARNEQSVGSKAPDAENAGNATPKASTITESARNEQSVGSKAPDAENAGNVTTPNQLPPSTRPRQLINGSRWGFKKDRMYEKILKDGSDIKSVEWTIDLQTKKLEHHKSIERLVKGLYRSLMDLYINDTRTKEQGNLKFTGLNMNVEFNDTHPAYKAALLIALAKANHYIEENNWKRITLKHKGKPLNLTSLINDDDYSDQRRQISEIYHKNIYSIMSKRFKAVEESKQPTTVGNTASFWPLSKSQEPKQHRYTYTFPAPKQIPVLPESQPDNSAVSSTNAAVRLTKS